MLGGVAVVNVCMTYWNIRQVKCQIKSINELILQQISILNTSSNGSNQIATQPRLLEPSVSDPEAWNTTLFDSHIMLLLQLANETIFELEEELKEGILKHHNSMINDTNYLTSRLDLHYVPYGGQSERYPALSCEHVTRFYDKAPSGYYWITSSNGTVMLKHCDLE